MADRSRREFVAVAGASLAVAAGAGGLQSIGAQSADGEFTVVEDPPTTKTLFSAVGTETGPYAVGAGGDVLARGQDGWRKVVEYGPQARSRPLRGAAVTDDGKAIWFVGGSGVIGEYRVDTRTLTNYSAPQGKTSTWEDCAVVGNAGDDERLYFVNGSGELLIGVRQDSGAVQYKDVLKPGGGSTIPGLDFHGRGEGHVISTSQFVAETTDGGMEWTQIGIGFAGGAFFDVASVGPKDVNVAGGGGIVYRYDGFRWTPHVVDDGRQAIRGIDRDGDEGFAAGAGGKVYERQSAGQWRRVQTPSESQLNGAASGEGYAVAVGAGGTIVERVDGESGSTNGTNTTTATTNTTGTNTTEATNTTGRNATNASSVNATGTTTTETTMNETAGLSSAGGQFAVAVDPTVVETVVEGTWLPAGADSA